jgi:3D (Asp-Asp-Asp) domain-containing protein
MIIATIHTAPTTYAHVMLTVREAIATLVKRVAAMDKRLQSAGLLAGVVAFQMVLPSNALSGQVPVESTDVRLVTAPLPYQKVVEPKYGFPQIEEFPKPAVVKTMRVTATAYNSVPEQTDGDPFTTAAGTRTRPGVVAACFPFGTQLEIIVPGQEGSLNGITYVVEDRTGAGRCDHVDIWMETIPEARQFGRRTVEIRFIEPVDFTAVNK